MMTGAGSANPTPSPSDLTAAGTSLYFFTTDQSTGVVEFWVTPGTSTGTTVLATIPAYTPPGQGSPAAPTPTDLTAVGSRVFFVAEYYYAATLSGPATTHDQLWTSDGTALGTTFLPGPAIDSTFTTVGSLEPLGGQLLFQAIESPGGATELWKSDGSAAGTTRVANLSNTSVPQGIPNYPQGLAVGGILYFAANDGVHGQELWRTDGTPGGTGLAVDINPGAGSSNPIPLAALGGQLALIAGDGIHGAQLMQAILSPASGSPTPTPSPTSSPAPRIAPIPTQTASDGSTFVANLAAYVSDPASPSAPLTYGLGPGAPAGLGINPTTGALTWTIPANQTIGSYPVTLIVTAAGSPGSSSTATETFALNVVDPGPAPVVSRATVTTKHGLTIMLTYSQPMAPASVLNPGNYLLEIPTKVRVKHKKGPSVRMTPVRLKVSYNPATDQVILKAIGRVSLAKPLELTVVGASAGGVSKVTGLPLAGSGQPGTDYLATVTSKRVNPALAVAGNTITPHKIVRPAARALHRPGGPMALAKS
jgi:ELWxxDGT repeat protein